MFTPQYTLTDSIVQDLTLIAEGKAVIERAKILPTAEIRLRRQALVRMTHSSTAIEGNILNLRQVEDLAAGRKIEASQRDIFEVKNYLQAMKYIEKITNNKEKITENNFLKIHRLVTQNTLPIEKSGAYRKGPMYVVRHFYGFNKKVVYTAPVAKKVPALVSDLFSWLNKKETERINPVIVAGIVHQEIVAIHPFFDGNGRTARATATLILYKRGYDFRKLFALEDYYNRNREKYYQAINIGKDYEERKKDMSLWLSYFVQGFREEIDNVKAKVQALSIKKIDSSLPQVFLDEDQQKIIGFIDQVGKINIGDAISILDVPKRTAQLKLAKLKSLKIIKQIGKGPSSAYMLT